MNGLSDGEAKALSAIMDVYSQKGELREPDIISAISEGDPREMFRYLDGRGCIHFVHHGYRPSKTGIAMLADWKAGKESSNKQNRVRDITIGIAVFSAIISTIGNLKAIIHFFTEVFRFMRDKADAVIFLFR